VEKWMNKDILVIRFHHYSIIPILLLCALCASVVKWFFTG